MNPIVFPISLVGEKYAGAYIKADEVRAQISNLEQELANERHDCADLALQVAKLEQQLSRYQGGVEVEVLTNWQYSIDNLVGEVKRIGKNKKVRVLVMEVE